MSRGEDVVEHGYDDGTTEHDNGVVHSGGGDWDCVGPETPKEDDPRVSGADTVDHDTPVAETESARWQEVRRGQAAVQNASDRDTVCAHHGRAVQ